MKKLCVLLLFTPLLLATTCDDIDYYPAIGLEGQWNLINIDNESAGSTTEFEKGVVMWEFTEKDNRVKIVNNADEEIYSGPTGHYTRNYSFGTGTGVCENTFTLRIFPVSGNKEDYGCIEISADTLRLSKNYEDGNTFTFVR